MRTPLSLYGGWFGSDGAACHFKLIPRSRHIVSKGQLTTSASSVSSETCSMSASACYQHLRRQSRYCSLANGTLLGWAVLDRLSSRTVPSGISAYTNFGEFTLSPAIPNPAIRPTPNFRPVSSTESRNGCHRQPRRRMARCAWC